MRDEIGNRLVGTYQRLLVYRNKRIQFEPRLNIARPNVRRAGLPVKADICRTGNKRIGPQSLLTGIVSGIAPGRQPHAPYQFKLILGKGASQLLLQGKQGHMQLRQPAAVLLTIRPRLPSRLQVQRVLLFDFGTEAIVGKAYACRQVDRRVSSARQVRCRNTRVTVGSGGHQRSAIERFHQHRLGLNAPADAKPGNKPVVFRFRRNLRTAGLRNGQPGFFVTVSSTLRKANAIDTIQLMIEQQETVMRM